MEQKDSMAGPSAWFCFILSFDSIKNSCIFRRFVLTCMPAASAETGRIHSSWQIFEKISTCAIGLQPHRWKKFITLIKVLNKQATYFKKVS